MAPRETMNKIIPLIAAPPGISLRVISIEGGWGISRRLLEIGITPGTIVKIISKDAGPIVLEVRGTVFAIGRGHARKIYVEVL